MMFVVLLRKDGTDRTGQNKKFIIYFKVRQAGI